MSEQIGMGDTMRDKALEWVEKQIRQTRHALGRAEYKPGVKPEELENLRAKIELLEFISGAALRAETAEPKWISVKDRLPEEDGDSSELVLVTCYFWETDSRFVCTDITCNGRWVNYSGPEYEITHWMPLPEPPKEE